MGIRSHDNSARPALLIALVLLLALGGAFVISETAAGLSLGATLLILVLIASFLNTELGLHLILFSMLLSPEIVVGSVGGISLGKPDIKGDVLVLRIEDLILVAVALAWFARTAIFKELGLIRKTPLNAPIFAYIVSLMLATFLGFIAGNVRPTRGFFFTVKYIEYFVVYFMTVNYIREERQLTRLLTTAFVTCAISVIIGITQIPSGERVSAPFEGKLGEPNTFGGYLVLMLALILGFALCGKTLPGQLGWFAFAGLAVIPLLFTLSRSSWLAAVPMLLTLILFSPRRLLLMVGLGILIISGSFVFPKQVVDRYNYTLNEKIDRGDYQIGGNRLDSSTSARLDSWKQGLRGWSERPFFGYGVTGFGFMDAQFVRVLVEAGLFGLAAFLWLLWRIFRVAWHTYGRAVGTPQEGLALGYVAGLVAMVTHGIGANTFIIVRIMEPFWFMTGVIVLLPGLLEESSQGTPAPPGDGGSWRNGSSIGRPRPLPARTTPEKMV